MMNALIIDNYIYTLQGVVSVSVSRRDILMGVLILHNLFESQLSIFELLLRVVIVSTPSNSRIT